MVLPENLERLNLNERLKRLGSPILSELVGVDRIKNIIEISSARVKESNLVKFLMLRHGSQVFSVKEIRREVLLRLPTEYQLFILYGATDIKEKLSEADIDKLYSFSWSRSSNYAKRLLAIFDLDDSYLPPVNESKPSHEELSPETQLYPYQLRIKNQLIRSLSSGQQRLLVHMPTGSGKTRTSIEAIVDYWRAVADRSTFVVWLAHSEELCEQAVETFTKLWSVRGDAPVTIYRLWGDYDVPSFESENGFLVASLQKIHSMRLSKNSEIFRSISRLKAKCKFILIDEAHKAIAPTYRSGIEFISDIDKTFIVGLSATPGRVNSEEIQELVDFFGGQKISLTSETAEEIANPIKFLQENRYLSKIVRKEIPSEISIDLEPSELEFISNFLDLPKSVLVKLEQSAARNACILGEIASLCRKNYSIIVFALSVNHAHMLTELLNIKDIEARCVDGNCSSYDRQKYIEDYKKNEVQVLVNYGVLTTGFDAPNTNAVLIARPTGSLVLYSQMIGRGIRGPKMGGNEECILVDIKDNLVGFPEEDHAFTNFNSDWQ
ncbi:DEAD/DEAH box helicase [Limisalsivibrio acetivorans]|uniref:DEAD/DEAH box helicase n=1 Tax=Limisalsivibrio acetivorans TaxID=1304888 RepID=UPI0004124808|nr:DEAD/DEAH box helicase [Limisalsivibrio acetivorans]